MMGYDEPMPHLADKFDIEAMRANRTRAIDFHWIGETLMAIECGEHVELCSVDWSELDDFEAENKRRIASVPDMEAEIERLTADLARAVEALEKCEDIQRRVQHDTYWRSPDNTLWPDLCDTTNGTRTTIASIKERDNG